jgi:hypothetical protein
MRVEFDIPDDLLDPALAPHALAVGALCNAWAHMESGIRWLFLNVSQFECGPRTQIAIVNTIAPRDLMRAVKMALIESDRIQIIKDIGCDTLDYIDNELRPWRNRYVHDRWHHFLDDGDIARWSDTPTLKRAGAHRPLQLEPFSIVYDDVSRVYELAQNVTIYAYYLSRIGAAYVGGVEEAEALILGQPPQPAPRRSKEN